MKRYYGKLIRKGILYLAGMLLCFLILKALLWGRWNLKGEASGTIPRIDFTWEEANADGSLTEKEIAEYFAP
ncbi:MAG: hypothetical protein ACI4FZ_10160 [Lachnospiraceae bacterium]